MRKFMLLAAALLPLLATPAFAESGVALGVDQDAQAETSGKIRVLNVGSDVTIGDRVVTDANGLVQIKFSDRTELVVGPRSSLVIEDYLLRADGSAGKVVVNALAGSFRFVTGGAAKDRYVIKTPTGTVGVRGTAFDLNVAEGIASLLLFNGAVRMCNLRGDCVILDESCEIGQYDPTQAVLVGHADLIQGDNRATLRAMFPYSVSQVPLLREFWLEEARRCLNRPTTTVLPQENDDSEPEKRPNSLVRN